MKFVKKEEELVRSSQAKAFVTPLELLQIDAFAASAGMSRSDYMRHRALSHRVVSKVDLGAIGQLNRIGGLIKLLYNAGQLNPEQSADLLRDIGVVIAHICNDTNEEVDAE